MSHAKTLTFCSLLTRCTIPCACHAKRALNVQKWSELGVFCTFWLRNMLRATTACTFSTSHLPKVVRQWCALYILTWKCASRHNGVQFFISHLASWLRTRGFSEPTFRPSGATKHCVSRLSYLFAHLHLLSSDSFSSHGSWILYELWRDKVWKLRLIKKRILGKGHQMTRVLQPQRDIDREKEGEREREKEREIERKHEEI